MPISTTLRRLDGGIYINVDGLRTDSNGVPYTGGAISGDAVFHVSTFGAVPNTGECSLKAIQAAIEAASAVGGVVVLDAGIYYLNPDNIVYPERTSEGHPSCLTIWADDVKIVGAGGWATTLKLTKTIASGAVINMLGSGSTISAGDATDTTFDGIRLSGFNLDANGFRAECTQIYNATDWIISDVGVRNTIAGCDGFDTQGGNGIRCYNIFAIDIQENAFGSQDTNLYVDGFFVLRCGKTGGTGSAFQFSVTQPLFKNVVALDCKYLLAAGSNCYFVDSYLESNNADASHYVFDFAVGQTGTFQQVVIVTPLVATGAIIRVAGGTANLDGVTFVNHKPGVLMTSGNLLIQNSYLGSYGGQRPLVVNGGTSLRVIGSTLSGGSSGRDFRVESGSVANIHMAGNSFIGTGGGAYFDSSGSTGLVFENNYCATGAYFSVGAGSRIRNNTFLGAVIAGGGTMTFEANYFNSTYTHNAGTVTFVNGNVFATAANTTEVAESNVAFTAITPTTTTTTYTNNNPFTVEVYFRGGTIDSVSKNGTPVYGVSTAGNSLDLGFGETISIANSVIAGMSVAWIPKR